MKTPIFLLAFFTIIFPILLIGQSSWERVTPLPQENNLNDIIKIPGTNKLIATGGGSTVMTSVNAGETWQINYHPAGMDNNYSGECICFINATTGFIGGSYLSILKTTDGGINWYIVDSDEPNNYSDRIEDIDFINETTGFAVGDYTSINKTTDGGETWTSMEAGNDFNLHQVEFCNETTGFIIGSSNEYMLKTIDGGNNWQIIDYPTGLENLNPEEIYFYNETLGFIFCSIYGASSTATILKTTDLGVTWTIVHTNPSAFGGSIDFIDDQHGIIGVGSWYSSNIFLTENGGDDWTNIDLPGFSWWNTNSVCFLDQENVFFAGHLGMLFKSPNGGHNWEALHERTIIGEIFNFQFINDGIAYAISAGGSGGVSTYDIYNSTDGGNSWSHLVYFLGVSAYHFINEEIGFVAENMIGLNVYKTTNSGLDWTEIESGNFDFEPRAIKFYDANNGIITGMGQIIKTTDSGNNWEEVYYASNNWADLNDIEFISEEKVFVVGSDEFITTMILKSNDGGNTWEADSLGNYWAARDLFFVDEDIAFIACENNAILKSVDGGDTWTETIIESPNPISFHSVYFPSNEIGYALGDGPFETIVKTIDGGETWFAINAGTTSGLNGVYFSDENNGLIAGQGGVILKTTTGGITGFEETELVSRNSIFDIYPNPFANNITINFHQPEKFVSGQLIIYDQAGKSIQNIPIINNSDNISLSLGHLKPGVYFVQLKTANGIDEVKKMLKL